MLGLNLIKFILVSFSKKARTHVAVILDTFNHSFFETATNKLSFHLQKIMDFTKYFFKKYIYTINHKRIALNYFIFCTWSGLSGATLATMIRLELAYPGSHFFGGDSIRYLQVITAHGLTMVFFVVVPLVFGCAGNFFIPYHVGSKDVAFPRLNSLGFWLLPAGYLLLSKPAFLRSQVFKYYDEPGVFYAFTNNEWHDIAEIVPEWGMRIKTLGHQPSEFEMGTQWPSWKVHDKKEDVAYKGIFTGMPPKYYLAGYWENWVGSSWALVRHYFKYRKKKSKTVKCKNPSLVMSGWTFITPFSSKTQFTGMGAQDVAIISVLLSGFSTTISFTNLLITRRTLSMPGLRNRRVLVPFLSIALFLTMRMLALITPVLGAAMLMLLMDRHWNTSFFDYAYGGDVILFHHLFWFFGHPEVYVVIIPAFGIVNMLLPYYSTRRIASKHHLIWATYIMGYMGFLVWGHHMYLIGLDHRSRSMYSTITVMISLPAIVKIVNWTLTILNGALKIDTAFLFVSSFFFFFLCGGLTGMWLSHVGLNIYVHDTFYVVAHFHFLFSAATFSAIYAAIYYYFSAFFGIKYSKIFSYLHVIYWTAGQWLTFLPLFWVGYNGLPRRYHDYPVMYLGWHGMASVGHLLTIISVFFFFLMLGDSFLEKKIHVHSHLGMPRFHKRISWYLFKIRLLQLTNGHMQNDFNLTSKKLLNNFDTVEYENIYVSVMDK